MLKHENSEQWVAGCMLPSLAASTLSSLRTLHTSQFADMLPGDSLQIGCRASVVRWEWACVLATSLAMDPRFFCIPIPVTIAVSGTRSPNYCACSGKSEKTLQSSNHEATLTHANSACCSLPPRYLVYQSKSLILIPFVGACDGIERASILQQH